ncbi:hypothetical protein GH741_14195 [Aquibacillus halophilus]|uniref:YbbR-like domain-containing protein n=1 Tax=Aquibacillus halophilus TaxID=930132 RepID=A0A6A8DDQ4_9BACI|nr:CdaR family protein [Aquibacillus halophilus]MRH43825.1 hypothetical protein [Aquibacillus halophilus]
MDNWLKSPWVIRFISLALAILLFTTVSLSENSRQSADTGVGDFWSSSDETQVLDDIPVNIQIDQEKYVVSGVPSTVSVTLQGPNSSVTSTSTQRNFDVFVDLEGFDPGTYMVELEHSGISNNLDVYIEPKEVEVTIEERAVDQYDITVDYINEDQIEPGFEVVEGTTNPVQVTITSSKNVIEKIATVKVFVNLQGVDEPIDGREVPVKVYDSEGNELNNARIEPSVVEVTVDVQSPSKVVPIEVTTTGEVQDGITINTITPNLSEVRIFAPEDVLATIEEIETEPLDLTGITEVSTVQLQLNVPSEIRKIETEQVEVSIQLDRTAERVFNLPIEIQNLTEEYSLTFIEPAEGEMDLTVLGLEEEIGNLSEEDLQLSINLDGRQTEEEFEIPVEINAPEGINFEPEYRNIVVRLEQS